jgi:hypothetical protein
MQLRHTHLIGVVLLVAACDVPTQVPKWDMTWNVPSKSTSMSVNAMLPSGVTANGALFQVAVNGVTITRSLAQDCAVCALAAGATIAKPSFTATGTGTAALPAGVVSALLGTNALTVTVQHNYGFDPLRPSAAARGWLRIVVTSGATVVGRDSVNGATTAMPSGGTLTRTIPLTGAVTSSDGVLVTTTVDSPAGDNVPVDGGRTMTFGVQSLSLGVSQAQLKLVGQTVNTDLTAIDLSGIDSAIRDRAVAGTLVLTITNPFTVTGGLTMAFNAGGQVINKAVALELGTKTSAITFTAAEIKAMLGNNVALKATGSVSGAAVSVQPGQTVAIATRLQLTLNSTSN